MFSPRKHVDRSSSQGTHTSKNELLLQSKLVCSIINAWRSFWNERIRVAKEWKNTAIWRIKRLRMPLTHPVNHRQHTESTGSDSTKNLKSMEEFPLMSNKCKFHDPDRPAPTVWGNIIVNIPELNKCSLPKHPFAEFNSIYTSNKLTLKVLKEFFLHSL